MGRIGIADGAAVGDELAVTTDVASYVMVDHFGTTGVLLFVLVIFMAGMTTASNTLAGFQANIAVDFQEDLMPRQRTALQKKRQTQLFTLLFGAAACLGALLLEGVSLLQIDIFSGIIFATPMAALIFGVTSRRPNATLAIASIVVGLVAGLVTYFAVADPDLNYFYGNVVSLLTPAVVIIVGQAFTKDDYDFSTLLQYRSKHRIDKEL